MKTAEIKKVIRKTAGISELNPMQAAVAASDSSRLVLLSPTGSGKTLAFAVAVLRRIPENETADGRLHAVIVAPTRELVRQIYDVIRPVAATFGIKSLAVYGGNPFGAEESSLRGAVPSILVATPGRLLDHIQRGTLDVSTVPMLVLDEYDKILDLGFQEQMSEISKKVGASLPGRSLKFAMLTSATECRSLPPFIDLSSAEVINCTEKNSVEARLQIVHVPSFQKDKLETLAALVRATFDDGPCICFVNHRESADRVAKFLDAQKISNVVYHGGLDQQQREIALALFDSKAAHVLVSTDLAGRGIDIEGVKTIIHYHPAADKDIWTHRNGRTARVDNTGNVYVITAEGEDLPDFVEYERELYPDMTADFRIDAEMALVYFDKGKRDKISRGDVAGFVMKKADVPASCVGKITLGLSYALVAVNPLYVEKIVSTAKANKVKNVKVRASLI